MHLVVIWSSKWINPYPAFSSGPVLLHDQFRIRIRFFYIREPLGPDPQLAIITTLHTYVMYIVFIQLEILIFSCYSGNRSNQVTLETEEENITRHILYIIYMFGLRIPFIFVLLFCILFLHIRVKKWANLPLKRLFTQH